VNYEVEQKFYVDDLAGIERALQARGLHSEPPSAQTDTYFRHPARDFSASDEALRLRREGDASWITYKGPRIDPTTKTRLELDIELGRGAQVHAQLQELLRRLGFEELVTVRKQRRRARAHWQGAPLDVVLDQVEELGRFVAL
jgi:adenylate cyclase class 2